MSAAIDTPSKIEVRPAITPPDHQPMSLIALAVARGASTEELRELFKLKREVEEYEAKKAYAAAMSAFKAEAIAVTKDKENKQFTVGQSKAMYTSIGNLVNTVTPFLAKHGLSAAWGYPAPSSPTNIAVRCTLTHTQGHSESETFEGPADTSGSKNVLQARKSTTTYLRILTFESVCGLASREANADDDGNGAAGIPSMAEEDLIFHLEKIRESKDEGELFRNFKSAVLAARKAKDTSAEADFGKAKNIRKSQLGVTA